MLCSEKCTPSIHGRTFFFVFFQHLVNLKAAGDCFVFVSEMLMFGGFASDGSSRLVFCC